MSFFFSVPGCCWVWAYRLPIFPSASIDVVVCFLLPRLPHATPTSTTSFYCPAPLVAFCSVLHCMSSTSTILCRCPLLIICLHLLRASSCRFCMCLTWYPLALPVRLFSCCLRLLVPAISYFLDAQVHSLATSNRIFVSFGMLQSRLCVRDGQDIQCIPGVSNFPADVERSRLC